MPTGPKGQKRPADVIGNAIRVAQIATGEAEEEYEAKPEKNAAAAELGRKGGAARAKSMSPEKRAEIARNAAEKRWKNKGRSSARNNSRNIFLDFCPFIQHAEDSFIGVRFMPDRSMDEVLDAVGSLLDEFDMISRSAHARFRAYRPEDLIELDSRAQAN